MPWLFLSDDNTENDLYRSVAAGFKPLYGRQLTEPLQMEFITNRKTRLNFYELNEHLEE